MKWILLALVLPLSGSYVGLSAEFNSQKACQYAGTQITGSEYARKYYSGEGLNSFVCVPKGEELNIQEHMPKGE